MFALLRQPYPAPGSGLAGLRVGAFVGLFIGLFLLVFQPFGLSEWQTTGKAVKIAGFGLISFLITALHGILWPALFPAAFADARWTVGKALGFILLNILFVAFGNFAYLRFLFDLPFDGPSLLWTLFITLTVGFFPATGLVLLGYIHRLRTYQQTAATLASPASLSIPPEAARGLVTFTADNGKDSLTIELSELLWIESSDNYCTIFFRQNATVQKQLLRSSLSRLETQLADQPRLVRCHRSFVVNLDQVERVTGNAQGYRLHLRTGGAEIPVSRRYNNTLIAGLS